MVTQAAPNSPTPEPAMVEVPAEGTNEWCAARLRGEAFLMEDSARGHRKRIDVRTMKPMPMTSEQRIMVAAYERASAIMRDAADRLAAIPTDRPIAGDGVLREALTACRDQFRFYEVEHKAKADNAADTAKWRRENNATAEEIAYADREESDRRAKEQTNKRFVDLADAALTSARADHATPDDYQVPDDFEDKLRAAGWVDLAKRPYDTPRADHGSGETFADGDGLREAAGLFAFEQRDDDKPDSWNEACDHIANAFRHDVNPFGIPAIRALAQPPIGETRGNGGEGALRDHRSAHRLQAFHAAVAAIPHIAEKLAAGEQFNAYDSTSNDEGDDDDDCEMNVCIGPITDARFIVAIDGRAKAEMIASALTFAALATSTGSGS